MKMTMTQVGRHLGSCGLDSPGKSTVVCETELYGTFDEWNQWRFASRGLKQNVILVQNEFFWDSLLEPPWDAYKYLPHLAEHWSKKN